jgi:hypothetical protein
MQAGLIVCALALFSTSQCLAQSLGDVARQEKDRKSKQAASARHVYTEDDLPGRTPEELEQLASQKFRSERNKMPSSQQDPLAERIRADIRFQKQSIKRAEDRISELKNKMEPYQSNGTPLNCASFRTARTTYPYDASQARLAVACNILVDQEEQLEKARQQLQEMQEQARKMGYHSAVYDPD